MLNGKPILVKILVLISILKKGKAGLVVDIYEQDKNDMLLAIVTPISAGSTPVNGQTYDRFLTNVGNLRNS